MKKTLVFVGSVLLALFVSCAKAPVEEKIEFSFNTGVARVDNGSKPMTGKTGLEITKEMKTGWNLGNTLEANASKGKHFITTNIEHHAVLHTCEFLEKRGFEVTYLDVDENGVVKLDELKAAIREDTILVSINSVNSETGIMQPIDEIKKIVKICLIW